MSEELNEFQRMQLETIGQILDIRIDGEWDETMIDEAFDGLERLLDGLQGTEKKEAAEPSASAVPAVPAVPAATAAAKRRPRRNSSGTRSRGRRSPPKKSD